MTGMLRRVMVVVLLGCLGLTAGVTLGTLFPSNQTKPFVLNVQTSCDAGWRLYSPSDLANTVAGHHPPADLRGVAHGGGCLVYLPVRIRVIAPSGRVPMGGYVLLGLLAGPSAALGFLVPPRSRLTRR